jgi:hypothetical protein
LKAEADKEKATIMRVYSIIGGVFSCKNDGLWIVTRTVVCEAVAGKNTIYASGGR